MVFCSVAEFIGDPGQRGPESLSGVPARSGTTLQLPPGQQNDAEEVRTATHQELEAGHHQDHLDD